MVLASGSPPGVTRDFLTKSMHPCRRRCWPDMRPAKRRCRVRSDGSLHIAISSGALLLLSSPLSPSGTENLPNEEGLGQISLQSQTSGQKLGSGPPNPGKTRIVARTSHGDVHHKASACETFRLIFCALDNDSRPSFAFRTDLTHQKYSLHHQDYRPDFHHISN